MLASSCSSSKKSSKTDGSTFQNTVARYNGYYYAHLKMTEAENQMIAGRKYDYNKLLPLFKTGNPDDAVNSGDMDSVIRRLTIVVKLHPKTKWTDDSYFNIGKAYYYKKNYEAALATFQYVSANFNPDEASPAPAKSKSESTSSKPSSHGKPQSAAQKQKAAEEEQSKEDAKDAAQAASAVPVPSSSGGFLKHKPIRNEDLIWLAQSYTSLEKYSDAQSVLSFMKSGSLSSGLREQYALVQANLFIQQKQYGSAIEPLRSAVSLTKDHKDKARYTYILAQLYQLSKNYQLATQYFQTVASMNPSYDMGFNARIAVARNYILSGTGSPSAITAQLGSMLKDDKYEDSYDQIYYEIALVDLRDNKEDMALKNLEASIKKSTTNTNQKGLSFLKLGEMDFAAQDYLTASPHYDSAVAFLDSKFDTINRVKAIQVTLKRLSDQYAVITEQDSLQKIANMSEADRTAFINDKIEDIEKAKQQEEKDSLLNEEAFQVQQLPGINSTAQNQAQGGTWYFYNTSLKASGFNDFRQKWGNRANQDNWRRSDKSSSDIVNNAPTPGTQPQNNNGRSPAENLRTSMLSDIPLTPEKMAASNKTIFDAYYVMGTLYRNDLHDLPKATETFEKMASRFQNYPDLPQVYYSLYLIYNETGNASKAEAYKQLLIKNFPSSAFASVLSDPNYLRRANEKKNDLNTYYASTYNYYETEKYSDVIARARAADTLFKNNPLQPKFDLLEAFAIGKTQDQSQFIAALDSFVKRYPDGAEHDLAVDLLIKMGIQPAVTKASENAKAASGKTNESKESPYQLHANNPQYLVIVFHSVSSKNRDVMDSIDNYNSLNHSNDGYKVNAQLLDTKTQMILVKQMKNSKEAISYYNEISDEDGIFDPVEDSPYDIFIIDDTNYKLFYQRKNLEEYRKFFDASYDTDDEGN